MTWHLRSGADVQVGLLGLGLGPGIGCGFAAAAMVYDSKSGSCADAMACSIRPALDRRGTGARRRLRAGSC